jgi:hypothetical protein
MHALLEGEVTAMKRRQPEAAIQRGVCDLLMACAAHDCFWFHVGNGGWRSPTEAKIFKSLGVKAGVPDLIFIRKGQTYGLELKPSGGRLTPAQRTCHVLMRQAGAVVETAVGIDATIERLREWDLLRGRVA